MMTWVAGFEEEPEHEVQSHSLLLSNPKQTGLGEGWAGILGRYPLVWTWKMSNSNCADSKEPKYEIRPSSAVSSVPAVPVVPAKKMRRKRLI
uniref:Uncharacterized protein n=1 Tax=Nelumbo nucifera TaxID=4432 RepID=A0A822X9U9_NELNU|nr:TPA_asm: hypothetical protein HUJ06_019697 [Nelumbo nucifera]